MRRLRAFWAAEPSVRILLLEAFLLPLFIRACFSLTGASRTQGWLRRWAFRRQIRSPGPGPQAWIRHAIGAQRAVNALTGLGGSCLVRSFTLWTLLLRRGVATDLRVGFRKHEGEIEGHAWLEFDQSPVNEPAATIKTYFPYSKPAAFDDWRRMAR